MSWSETIGSSGTVKAIGNVAQAAGWCDTGITRSALERIRDAIIECGSIDKLRLPGLAEDRMGVFAGGVAILEASFAALDIRQMRVCETAMREGLLYDMVGRAEHRDPRTASIDALAQRYGVDRAHAARVEATALVLFDSVARDWQLGHDERDWLTWAARIHEIGLAIAHSQHHIHGAYIVENSDLAGFARHEQLVLAIILRCHRRKPDQGIIDIAPERLRRSTARVTALLRLAVLLQRARQPRRCRHSNCGPKTKRCNCACRKSGSMRIRSRAPISNRSATTSNTSTSSCRSRPAKNSQRSRSPACAQQLFDMRDPADPAIIPTYAFCRRPPC